MKRLIGVLGVCVLIFSATAEHASGASVEPTCAALQSFADHGSIADETARLEAGRADLKEARRAANQSGDRKLRVLTRTFRSAFEKVIARPNNGPANRALDKAGLALWSYCDRNQSPIRRTPPSNEPDV